MNEDLKYVIGLIVILALGIGGSFYILTSKKPTMDDNSQNTQTTDEVSIEDITVGTGDEAVSGKTLRVHYRGTLENGTEFDSSYDGDPFEFTLGAGQVIDGWDIGVAGMKVGGKRKLTIPPSLGYGATATGSIPANSTLIFEVELIEVK